MLYDGKKGQRGLSRTLGSSAIPYLDGKHCFVTTPLSSENYNDTPRSHFLNYSAKTSKKRTQCIKPPPGPDLFIMKKKINIHYFIKTLFFCT